VKLICTNSHIAAAAAAASTSLCTSPARLYSHGDLVRCIGRAHLATLRLAPGGRRELRKLLLGRCIAARLQPPGPGRCRRPSGWAVTAEGHFRARAPLLRRSAVVGDAGCAAVLQGRGRRHRPPTPRAPQPARALRPAAAAAETAARSADTEAASRSVAGLAVTGLGGTVPRRVYIESAKLSGRSAPSSATRFPPPRSSESVVA
jgi:hypothetical protein